MATDVVVGGVNNGTASDGPVSESTDAVEAVRPAGDAEATGAAEADRRSDGEAAAGDAAAATTVLAASDETAVEMKGWLMKRTRFTHHWKKQWFVLKNVELYYGDDEQVI